jgi:glycosyltransferase involved in cell wall biosynthesis
MPAYDAAATIAASIQSALAQTRSDFELIVADDGSHDGTVDIVRSFATDGRVRLVECDHRGPAAARNAAIAVASAPYVSLLDSDDFFMPTYLEVMGDTLDRAPDAGFAYTDAWMFHDVTRRFSRTSATAPTNPPMPPPADPSTFFQELLRRNFVYVGATVRRSALDAVGTFDEELRGTEDYDLWLRLVGQGFRAIRAPGTLAVYRQRPDSLSNRALPMRDGTVKVYEGLAQNAALSDSARDAARARLAEAKEERDAHALFLESRRTYLGLRPQLSGLKRRLFARRHWLQAPPPEVARAFPDLAGR